MIGNLRCNLCPDNLQAMKEDWDIIFNETIGYVHRECYSYKNHDIRPDEICVICEQNNPFIKCSECDVLWHLCCTLEKEANIIKDQFDNLLICTSHVDPFYL